MRFAIQCSTKFNGKCGNIYCLNWLISIKVANLKKAIYKPTKQNTVIINEFGDYCEILLDGEYKTVSKNDLEFIVSQTRLATLEELKENIFINCIKTPLSDIFYSYNTNRLTPEPHQYKPLIKFLNSQNNCVLIADEVGLGKTIEAGMILWVHYNFGMIMFSNTQKEGLEI